MVESSDEGYSIDDEYSWIQKNTVGSKGHEMLLQVPYDYINNSFNTENLPELFPTNFEELKDQILD